MPIRFVAASVGIATETLYQWRDRDPELEAAVKKAQAQAVAYRWEEIRKAGVGTEDKPGNWSALAWQLERGFPHEFGRPEVQLGVQVNSTTNNTALVISVEDALELQKRSRKVEAEVDELIATHRAKFEARHGPDDPDPRKRPPPRVVEAEVVQSPVVLPEEHERTASWWKQLSRGDGSRPISREAFMYALQVIAVKLRGVVAASRIEVDLEEGQLCLRDLHESLEQLLGPSGWQTLVQLGNT
jgi:hypothetical protein